MPLRSFKPISDERSRILILGSMPGPEALRRGEYYGFPGNHFWPILRDLLKGEGSTARPATYREKLGLLQEHHIALWDVLAACTRKGASDQSIRNAKPNNLVALIRRRPQICAVFLNGRTAERFYRVFFAGSIPLPAHTLPSTSPAHASMSYAGKRKAWSVILRYLENRNPWC